MDRTVNKNPKYCTENRNRNSNKTMFILYNAQLISYMPQHLLYEDECERNENHLCREIAG